MIALTIGAAVLTTAVAFFGGSFLPADVRVKILVNGLMLEFAILMLILLLAGDIWPRSLRFEHPYLRLTRRGLFSRETSECHVRDIRAIEVQQSVVGRLIGYGSIRVKRGSGEDFMRIDRVPSPESVRARLRQLSEGAR
ncbi:MAG: PH domain-containing protein [Phycisphaeraceae bacterium]|nr:PH domain-containing protein [Phycisphaeraceae bacterium]